MPQEIRDSATVDRGDLVEHGGHFPRFRPAAQSGEEQVRRRRSHRLDLAKIRTHNATGISGSTYEDKRAFLAALAIWLIFAFFWPIIAQLAAQMMVPEGAPPIIARAYQAIYEPMFSRVSPNYLFGEATLALLNSATRSLGPIFMSQLEGALVGAPIPFGQSVLLVWPHFTGPIAGTILLFTATYVAFQRQEIRA
jgi:ABC-type transport system involved in multi-copper enzyme maturation permease subunit